MNGIHAGGLTHMTHEVICLHGTVLHTVRTSETLLRLRFSGKAAVVHLEVGSSEQNQVGRGLVSRALKQSS